MSFKAAITFALVGFLNVTYAQAKCINKYSEALNMLEIAKKNKEKLGSRIEFSTDLVPDAAMSVGLTIGLIPVINLTGAAGVAITVSPLVATAGIEASAEMISASFAATRPVYSILNELEVNSNGGIQVKRIHIELQKIGYRQTLMQMIEDIKSVDSIGVMCRENFLSTENGLKVLLLQAESQRATSNE